MRASVDKDRYFRQNVIGISGVEFLWGLGLPLVTGKFLDRYSGLEVDAYRLVFLAAAGLAAAALWRILKTDFRANSANSALFE